MKCILYVSVYLTSALFCSSNNIQNFVFNFIGLFNEIYLTQDSFFMNGSLDAVKIQIIFKVIFTYIKLFLLSFRLSFLLQFLNINWTSKSKNLIGTYVYLTQCFFLCFQSMKFRVVFNLAYGVWSYFAKCSEIWGRILGELNGIFSVCMKISYFFANIIGFISLHLQFSTSY